MPVRDENELSEGKGPIASDTAVPVVAARRRGGGGGGGGVRRAVKEEGGFSGSAEVVRPPSPLACEKLAFSLIFSINQLRLAV